MKNFFNFRIGVIAVTTVIFVVFFASCIQNPQETIRIGYLPSLAASPMYAAIAEGYFEEEGLTVDIQEVYSGPELQIPVLVSTLFRFKVSSLFVIKLYNRFALIL